VGTALRAGPGSVSVLPPVAQRGKLRAWQTTGSRFTTLHRFSAGGVRSWLTQVGACLCRRGTFALETTLSGKTYIRLFRRASKLGYEIELHYLWLSSPAQAVARVRMRVRQGGHHVPAADVRRRFKRSLAHLVDDYLPLASRWLCGRTEKWWRNQHEGPSAQAHGLRFRASRRVSSRRE
jgi:hypothetical protein